MKRARIRFLQTRYPHWGAHAGFQQFLARLDRSRFETSLIGVGDGDAELPLPSARLRAMLRARVQRGGMAWYKLSDLSAELRSLATCLARRTDIVHYLDGEHGAQYLPRWLRRAHRKTRTVATYHQPVGLIGELVAPAVLRELDHVTLVAPDQREWFERHVDAERISVVLHGVDTDFFVPGTQRRTLGTFRCVSAGYWLRDWEAIRGVAERLHDHDDIEFHVIAPRPTGLEHQRNVTIHRRISDAGLLSIYQQSDAMLLPLEASTANNTLLEGIACGLPVITTRLEAVAAYLRHGEALLLDRNDPDALAEAVLYLKRHPNARDELAQAARRRACELDWRRIAPEYERIYDRLLER